MTSRIVEPIRRFLGWVSTALAAAALTTVIILGLMDVMLSGADFDAVRWRLMTSGAIPLLAWPAIAGTLAVVIAVVDAWIHSHDRASRTRMVLLLAFLNVVAALWYWWRAGLTRGSARQKLGGTSAAGEAGQT